MKREYKAIITKAIKESELNGYKWKMETNKLTWNYLTVEHFKFEIAEDHLKVIYVMPHLNEEETFVYLLVGEEFYNDAKTTEEALEKATKQTIKKANRLF
jgi:hypothetical protein